MLCSLAYLLTSVLGQGQRRGEFFGVALAFGVAGALLLVLNRVVLRRHWLHWLGLFCLNWLFAAYLLSSFAV